VLQQWTQSRQVVASHSHASLDRGPDCRHQCPCSGISAIGRIRERCHSTDGCHTHDNAEPENSAEGQLLSHRQLQFENDWWDHQHDDKVGRYIVDGIADPECTNVDTGAPFAPAVPGSGDGSTLKDCGHGEAGAGSNDQCYQRPAEPAKPHMLGKDSKVEEKDGEFGEVDRELVGNLQQEEALSRRFQ
jgi:hypothetical protein